MPGLPRVCPAISMQTCSGDSYLSFEWLPVELLSSLAACPELGNDAASLCLFRSHLLEKLVPIAS